MTPEEKSLLERTYKLAEENNDILRSIRRTSRITAALRILYWVVIVLAAFGAYYFIQPYVEAVTGLYDQVTTTQNDISPWGQAAQSLRDLLN